ncbi:MAG: amino acid adenylation domain-containing protein, partial [Actinomycetota bacterium]|nr:amino acid adenylation domain-containing protein [Actinomycetota bacterium]
VGSALLAAWSVLQSRYCSSTDVVFGTTRAGRHQVADAEDMVGCLINTVPIRLRPAADSSVDELLRAARAFQIDVRPHEHAALVDIRSWSDVTGDRPLMSTTVVFERGLLDTRLRAGGGRPSRHVTVHEQASSPLMLAAYLDDELVLRLEYDTASYRAETVRVMGDHLARLLESFAESGPDTRIGDLEMLGDDERRRLLEDRNPSQPVAVSTGRYVDRFEAQVERHPDAVAVEALGRGGMLSYRELDERANRLAHVLVDAGASQEQPVALCLARSTDFVVSVLAVLKAGAAYLPLDPAYPTASLSHMLDDSGARLVVADSGSVAHVPSADTREVLVIDRLPALDAAPTTPPERPPAGADDLAYVIYTSGTTGTPKGVMITDRSLSAFCSAVAERYELTSSDRILQFSSLSFDVSVEEMLPTLSVGAAVMLRSEDMSSSMRALVEASTQAGLSVLNLPSAIWHALVEHLDATGDRLAPSVRLVVVGGEKVNRAAYQVWARLHPEVRWLNGYGPTETTVTCTSFDPAGRYRPESGRELPIGRPLANARAYVLDETGSFLVPDGQVGELWIGGSGVALGYLGRPELTAERFRPDPFVADPAARMYRTGDRGRWSGDGDLEYLGRSDRQMKLRGFRIEPGEVERALEAHPGVRQAFVSLRPDPLGGERLVGWIVADGDAPDPVRVLAAARDRLPGHAVPSALVVTDGLVRTPAGKVDVDALPEPPEHGGSLHGTHSTGAAPTDEREADLCRVFGQVLGRSGPVAADASFFDLGGHSLLAVRLIGRLDAELDTRVSLSTLHRAPSPRALAGELRAESGTAAASSNEPPGAAERVYLSTIQPLGDRPPLYGIHVLGTNGAFFRPLAERLGVDQPVFGLSATHPDEQTPTAVEEIASLYVEEIERQHDGPVALAAVSLGGFVAFEVAQQLMARGREVQMLALFDSAGPGGRATVSTSRRIAIHAGLVRRGGRKYVAAAARRLLATLRERADTVRVRLHRRAGSDTPDDLWMHRFVLANAAAADRYVARPYPGPMTVFHAADEVFDTPEALRTALGWSCVADGPIEMVEVPGRHMSMLEEPHVAVLAEELRAAIDRAGS